MSDNDDNIFLTTRFRHFNFIEWFDLNSSYDSLFEILFNSNFGGDLLM